ncbi:PAS domain-containing protein [Pseudahrensia aquimaris]|uniref:PAS domain-containing protein n=1 Tax=Pseudahrensia aquimaris TaxID=744461 RepID=A0ABW3FD21_9HYPH
MRHDKTRKMQDYWMQLWLEAGMKRDGLGRSIWPERQAVQPMHCPELLGDMFILDITNGAESYRLAGTRLCAMMGRELKDEPFSANFDDADQRAAESWATGLADDDYLVLICSDGVSADGRVVPLETLMMPLNHNGQRGERVLGITVPLEMPAWLLSQRLERQTIRSVRILRPWELKPAAEQNDFAALGVQSPEFSNDFDTPSSITPINPANEPLIDENGAVRGAPFLRVLEGGRGG